MKSPFPAGPVSSVEDGIAGGSHEGDELMMEEVVKAGEAVLSRHRESQSLDSLQDLIAASFAAAEKALAECHAEASCLIAKYLEDARQSEVANIESVVNQSLAAGTTRTLEVSDVLKGLSKPPPTSTPSAAPQAQHRPLGWMDSLTTPSTEATTTEESNPKLPEETGLIRPPDFKPPAPREMAPSMDIPGLVNEVDSRVPSKDISRRPSKDAVVQTMSEKVQDITPQMSRAASKGLSRAGSKVQVITSMNSNESAGARFRGFDRRPSAASNGSHTSGGMDVFPLLPFWDRRIASNKKKLKRSNSQRSMSSCMSQVSAGGGLAEMHDRLSDFVISPSSRLRACWDIISVTFLIYDMVVLPLMLFDLPQYWWILVMAWTTRLFWSFDVPACFFTGILKFDGSNEMDPQKIASRYLLTWFWLDLTLLIVDWMEGVRDLNYTTLQVVRTMRLLRLLHLTRMRNLFRHLMERFQSEELMIVAGITQVMLLIVGTGHITACIWYGITQQDRNDTWVKAFHFEHAPFKYQYTTALHWSLMQFAGGMDEIVPQNTGERVYAILVFLLAFVMAATFVGRLTSSMTQLSMLAHKDLERLQVLKRYLHKNEISSQLAERVMHNAQHAIKERQRFMEESGVELLAAISESLRNELRFELYSPVLAVHPLFRSYIEICPTVIKKVCHSAVSQLLASSGDVIFTLGEVPANPRMLIVCSGDLTYLDAMGEVTRVSGGHWVSEPALWTIWTYHGTLMALTDCRIICLDANKFQELVGTFDHSDFDWKKYAKKFVESMNSGDLAVTDLPYDDDCPDELNEVLSYFEARACIAEGLTAWQASEKEALTGWRRLFPCFFGETRKEDTSVMPTTPRRSVLMKSG